MALHYVVAIKDRAIDAFMRPLVYPSLGAATREFQDEVNNTQSPLNKHPEDYDLYHVAMYDDHDGRFVQNEQITQIAIGKNAAFTKQ